jgi:hypothetical protein
VEVYPKETNLPPNTRTIRKAKMSKYAEKNDALIGVAVINHSDIDLFVIESTYMLKPRATLAVPETKTTILNPEEISLNV